jgi:hypothetical protein
MSNTNIGNNSGIIGDGNTFIINAQALPTQKQVEKEFLKLNIGDFLDITNEVDESLREKCISIRSYVKNPAFQLKIQLVNDDFHEFWLPPVASDMGGREKKQYWQVSPIYQNVVLPFSYFFITMDGLRYWVPLPKREPSNTGQFEIERNNHEKKYTITKGQ